MEQLPLDKTIPARGTHSLEPSSRRRGLRFSGSWSKAASTQSAIASPSVIVVMGLSGLPIARCPVMVEVRRPGTNEMRCPPRTFTVHDCVAPVLFVPFRRGTVRPLTCTLRSSPFLPPPCKRSVSHVYAPALRRLCGTAHSPSAQEPPRKRASTASDITADKE